MAEDKLTLEEQGILLRLAREVLNNKITGKLLRPLDLGSFPNKLREEGATFVTLKKKGMLRGCIGTLEPHQSLVLDVCEHVILAALQDYRFPPVNEDELEDITIEISRLTKPVRLDYKDADDLTVIIRPGVDGVVLRDGIKRATFLPQVWEKLPRVEEFLNHLCYKMGVPANTWQTKRLEVFTYQVEEFEE